jgi:Tol biopolymer transport system component
MSPAVSPDGRLLAYLASDADCQGTSLVVRDLTNDAERRWRMRPEGQPSDGENWGYCCRPAWAPDSRHLAYVATRVDSHSVWELDTADPAPAKMLEPTERARDGWENPVYKEDGTLLVSEQRYVGEDSPDSIHSRILDRDAREVLAVGAHVLSFDISGEHMLTTQGGVWAKQGHQFRLVRYLDGRAVEVTQGITSAAWGPR